VSSPKSSAVAARLEIRVNDYIAELQTHPHIDAPVGANVAIRSTMPRCKVTAHSTALTAR
jgi:hypothetical protein